MPSRPFHPLHPSTAPIIVPLPPSPPASGQLSLTPGTMPEAYQSARLPLPSFHCYPQPPQVDFDTWYYAPGMPVEVNEYDTSLAEQAYALAKRWHTCDVMGIGAGRCLWGRGRGEGGGGGRAKGLVCSLAQRCPKAGTYHVLYSSGCFLAMPCRHGSELLFGVHGSVAWVHCMQCGNQSGV